MLPAYYIVAMYMDRQNIAMGAAGSTIMLLIVVVLILPATLVNYLVKRRR